ncbi:MAG: transcriptional repressor [Leptospiraceae bacterium]|nr:transcriptional repressor [Leptospiraceae bacterium]
MNNLNEKKSIETLKRNKLKVTKSRVEVLNILQNSRKPLTHSEIMGKLDHSQNWDKVTIYRTLGELENRNVLKSFLNKERITFFVFFDLKKEHGHISCEKCGRLECIPSDSFELIWKKPDDFKVESIELIIRGYCKDCL